MGFKKGKKNGVPNFFSNLPKLGGGLADSITTKKDVGFNGRKKRKGG